MPLRVSPVSRNLNAQIMLLGLEFEDLLVITVFGVAAMLARAVFLFRSLSLLLAFELGTFAHSRWH